MSPVGQMGLGELAIVTHQAQSLRGVFYEKGITKKRFFVLRLFEAFGSRFGLNFLGHRIHLYHRLSAKRKAHSIMPALV